MKKTEDIVREMREAQIGRELRSEKLINEMHEIKSHLTIFIEEFEKELPNELVLRFADIEEAFTEYCSACKEEAFYHGFKLGLKIASEK